jgi:hypothetical protein
MFGVLVNSPDFQAFGRHVGGSRVSIRQVQVKRGLVRQISGWWFFFKGCF